MGNRAFLLLLVDTREPGGRVDTLRKLACSVFSSDSVTLPLYIRTFTVYESTSTGDDSFTEGLIEIVKLLRENPAFRWCRALLDIRTYRSLGLDLEP